jgi:hypothetical protein
MGKIGTTVGERRKMKNRGIASKNAVKYIHGLLPQNHFSA